MWWETRLNLGKLELFGGWDDRGFAAQGGKPMAFRQIVFLRAQPQEKGLVAASGKAEAYRTALRQAASSFS